MSTDQLLALITGPLGGTVGIIFAVWWLNKDRNSLITEWKEERNGRLRLIEQSNERCAEDRVILHKKIDMQETEIREMLKAQNLHLARLVATETQK
jgi:hypothetical protein